MIPRNTVLRFGIATASENEAKSKYTDKRPSPNLIFGNKKFAESVASTSMDVNDLLGEDFESESEIEDDSDIKIIPEAETILPSEDLQSDDEDFGVESLPEPKVALEKVPEVVEDEEFSEIKVENILNDSEINSPRPVRAKSLKQRPKLKMRKDAEEYEDDVEEEEEDYVVPDIQTITHLSKNLRNENFKFTVFNIKGTLINYLEMFGERKVARHVLDQDAHAFYEIHASYIPGGVVYRVLTKLGFKPIHPTDLEEDYPKDMSYDVAMSNGKLFINVFGGLQQHAHTEETVIRNLYARERMRYTQVPAPALGISASAALEFTNEKVAKNLLLASMQSHSIGKTDLSNSFFEEAMASPGIDSLILSMSEDYQEEDSDIFDDYEYSASGEEVEGEEYNSPAYKKLSKNFDKISSLPQKTNSRFSPKNIGKTKSKFGVGLDDIDESSIFKVT